MSRRHHGRGGWLVAGALISGLACSGDPTTTSVAVPTQVVKQAAADPNAATETAETVPFAYSPVGKRDPFRSFLYDIEQADVTNRHGRKREVTEKFELDQYHFTAVVTGVRQPKAMVEDPSGRGHVVSLGTHLGKNGGRVEAIEGNKMVIVEEAFDSTGKPIRVTIDKHLQKGPVEQTAEE